MTTLYDFTAPTITGEEVDLSAYEGQAVLVVNTASKCGFTPQYEGLEALYETYADQGLVVLGFPCNQFGSQEPGDDDEIRAFCQQNYGVTFPMFAKVDVNGDDAHPLYTVAAQREGRRPGRQDQVELHQVPGRQGRPGDQALWLHHQAREARRRHREGTGHLTRH